MRLKKSIKVYLIIIVVLFILILSIIFYRKNYIYKEIEINPNNFDVEVFSKVKLSSLINNVTLNEDLLIDTEKVGSQIIEFKYVKDKKKYKSKITINVEDTVAPVVFVKNITTTEGNKIDLINKFIAGDNYDNTPRK